MLGHACARAIEKKGGGHMAGSQVDLFFSNGADVMLPSTKRTNQSAAFWPGDSLNQPEPTDSGGDPI